ncbi:transporter substrate-binding domain-containing protein [Shewanella eurypsychrophilus]|uniref:Transporter substrate-binding domain-containing protein n=1 Tax=Shewanella eurypsychrophilus TaxID=2593656 RepID=A0ABX6V6D5_9GAMM|nr:MULTISPECIES: transporter substrate-binding domain-containing protein [Shewanella]QPG58193.2 transporter substrate-binding domain-containing protein [Shewanella eurypsychrophilus]
MLISNMSVSHANEPIEVISMTTKEWPPYQMQIGKAQSGIAIDALRCVMQNLEQKYEVIFLPWGRAQKGVELGDYDAFFSASHNLKRDNYAVQSNTFIEQEWNFYLRKNSHIKPNIIDIKSTAKFASRQHSNTTHWLHQNQFMLAHQVESVDKLVELLYHNRIDAVMENSLLFESAVTRAGLTKDQFITVHNKSKPLGVYFGKLFLAKHPDFLDKFNQHTAKCAFPRNKKTTNK